MFAENTDYEILTPDGWRDFNGVTITLNKITFTIALANGDSISATGNHYFFSDGKKIQLKNLQIGQHIDTVDGPSEILSIFENTPTSVYDIIEVDQPDHKFIVNNSIITKNCDEFAYVEPNIAVEFWTSISPTLATGGKAIITSTPNSDEDQFAQIWNEANKRFDEHGNSTELGRNGFYPCIAIWSEHPDRDEKWANEERSRVGIERFEREHECITGDSLVSIQWPNGKIEKISLVELKSIMSL